jgi:hypothetical protein
MKQRSCQVSVGCVVVVPFAARQRCVVHLNETQAQKFWVILAKE